MSEPFQDYPLEEIQESMMQVMDGNTQCFQKWTCFHCGSRQTMDVPNILFTTGRCERCSGITDIKSRGCNFLIVRKLTS